MATKIDDSTRPIGARTKAHDEAESEGHPQAEKGALQKAASEAVELDLEPREEQKEGEAVKWVRVASGDWNYPADRSPDKPPTSRTTGSF